MLVKNVLNENQWKMYEELRTNYERLLEICRLGLPDDPSAPSRNRIRLQGNRLIVDSQILNLGDRPLTLKLVSIFLNNSQKVSKKTIMQEMNGLDFYTRFSTRYIEGKEQNIIKLIMRARNLFKVYFAEITADQKWFNYNLVNEEWTLLEY